MICSYLFPFFFFFNDTATTEIYTLSLHDALPILGRDPYQSQRDHEVNQVCDDWGAERSEEHTSELQSRPHLVCRLLLEKKKTNPVSRILVDGRTRAASLRSNTTLGCLSMHDHDSI